MRVRRACDLGFRLYSGRGGLGTSYTGITLICVPCWFIAALFAPTAGWWIWTDGIIVPTIPFTRRGFEPIMPDPHVRDTAPDEIVGP